MCLSWGLGPITEPSSYATKVMLVTAGGSGETVRLRTHCSCLCVTFHLHEQGVFLSEAVSRDRHQAFSGWGSTGIFQPLFIVLVLPSSLDQPAELHSWELLTVSAVHSLPVSIHVPYTVSAHLCFAARLSAQAGILTLPPLLLCADVSGFMQTLSSYKNIMMLQKIFKTPRNSLGGKLAFK